MKRSKPLFAAMAAAWFFLILTVSIAAPLVCRPFYYAHINALNMPEHTGYTYEEIKQAFDEMMDFCFYGGEFSTGVMRWSESGKAHFVDVGVLFRINFAVMAISAIVLIVCYYLKKKKGLEPELYVARGPEYWGPLTLLIAFIFIGIIGSIDFDVTFTVFHKIFFPGKTNWIFDYHYDEIITVLPEVYFRNCAILIVATLIIFCLFMIRRENNKLKRKSVTE